MNTPPTALDPALADVRVEWGMARAEVALRSASVAFAEQITAIAVTLREARDFPEVFLGAAMARDSDAAAFAERAAVADLAVRLGLAEQTVRAQAHQAETLQQRASRVWTAFRDGTVCAPNARVVAELVATLPQGSWHPFETAVLAAATELAPARFRAKARAARERVEPQQLERRHQLAADGRRVFIDNDLDGMAWLTAYLPAVAAHRAMAHLSRVAASLATADDEQRTLGQLRADVAADLLAGVLGSSRGATVAVAVTVPVMTLLGHDEQPGILEGYGPIDAHTARRLAAHAPSFTRILTHPVTGAVLDVDRRRYRPPADLKRWLGVRDAGCTFPGCGRRAADCDLDHTVAWQDGGTTSASNLAHLCRHHHRLKHETAWSVQQRPGGIVWTSPTGAVRNADPPPF